MISDQCERTTASGDDVVGAAPAGVASLAAGIEAAGPGPEPDGPGVEELWRDGDVLGAMSTADRLLASGTDVDFRAAGVTAAAAAADGALLEAATRWRAIAGGVDSGAGVGALGRAAL
ncbi:MAG: hypothetical protein M3235_17230, partial [Actinomycetota bacterium]|nr:hypothetical protein [Actinomycetota bacterium]